MRGFDPTFSQTIGEHGWIGMSWPLSHGGGGRSNIERLVVTEELLRAGAPVAAHWTADRQIGPSIIRLGSEALQQEFLPAIRRAEVVFCVCLSEPDAGSDLAALRTVAKRVPGGWELSGNKVWTTSAHLSTHAYVLARTSKEERKQQGLTEFIVDMDSPGITVRPIRDLSGEHHFNEVFFEGVLVPDGRVLGAVGNGWAQATDHLAFERGGVERFLSTYPVLGAMLGAVRTNPDRAAKERIGHLAAQLVVLRRMSYDLAGSLDAGDAPARLAATLKLLGTLFEAEVVEQARYVFDVCGATSTDLALLEEAAAVVPTVSLRGGASEIMRTVISRAESAGGERGTVYSEDLRAVVDDVLGRAETDDTQPDVLWESLLELDWTGVGVAEAAGGAGGDLADAVEIAAGTGRHALSLPLWQTGLAAWADAEAESGSEREADADLDIRVRTREQILRAAATTGTVERVCGLSLSHVQTREQFGKPLFALQSVAHAFADMVAERDRAVAAIREALVRPDPAIAAAALVTATEAARRVAAGAHQLHGAIGVTEEHVLHRFTKQLSVERSRKPTPRALALEIGELVLGGVDDRALWSFVTGAQEAKEVSPARYERTTP